MKKFLLSLAVILSLTVVLTGCGNQPQTHTHENGSTTSSQQSAPSESKTDSAAKGDVSDNSVGTQSDASSEQSTVSKPDNDAKISRDKAKEIALKDAGVKEADIYDFDIELDYDGGVLHYDIDFEVGGKDYEYKIDAQKGTILLSSTDSDIKPSGTENSSKPAQNEDQLITKDQAKNIALKDAGVKESDIYGFEIELDTDDGSKHYEIEFKKGNTEYKYDINAKSGAISDKEIDND